MKFVLNSLVLTISSGQQLKFLDDYDTCDKVNPWLTTLDVNKQPVIGILSQTYDFDTSGDPRFDNHTSYIMAAYVKFMESAGARVVPILYDEPEESILEKVSKLDGVLYPGGGGDYIKSGQTVLDQIMKYNDAGQFYPAWGTCLGFERLAYFTASDPDNILDKYGVHHESIPIEFKGETKDSKMFCQLEESFVSEFQTGNYTYNSHQFSIDPQKFETDEKMKDFWTYTSTSKDGNGREFVSSMEAKNYPFLATQFHPEKTTQVFYDGYGINHSWQSIKMNRYFADLFLQMARANTNSFGDFEETQPNLIQNYDLVPTTKYIGDVYIF